MRLRYKKKSKTAAVAMAAVDKNKGKWLVERQGRADRAPAVVAHQVVVLDTVGKCKSVPVNPAQRLGMSKVAGSEPAVRSNLDTVPGRMGEQMWQL